MIAKPSTRQDALTNAIHAAENAHMAADSNRPYPADTWASVSRAWTAIAENMYDTVVQPDLPDPLPTHDDWQGRLTDATAVLTMPTIPTPVEDWHPTLRVGETTDDVPLSQWIGEALGAASMCWVIGGQRATVGTFDSVEAKRIADALQAHVMRMLDTVREEHPLPVQNPDGELRGAPAGPLLDTQDRLLTVSNGLIPTTAHAEAMRAIIGWMLVNGTGSEYGQVFIPRSAMELLASTGQRNFTMHWHKDGVDIKLIKP